MLLQNTPISCRVCGRMTPGREYTVRNNDGSSTVKCEWRCPQCGAFLKQGDIRHIPSPNENK